MTWCKNHLHLFSRGLLTAEQCNSLALHLDQELPCCNNSRFDAMDVLRFAAMQGHEVAQMSLAIILEKSKCHESLMWFTRAAHTGNAMAQYKVGLKIIEKNVTVGLNMIEMAASNGDNEARAFIETYFKKTLCTSYSTKSSTAPNAASTKVD